MALFDKLLGSADDAPAMNEREEKLQKLICEGNEYMRQQRTAKSSTAIFTKSRTFRSF